MRSSVFISALVGVLLAASFVPETDAQNVGDLLGDLTGDGLVNALTQQLVGLWQTGELEFMDRLCNFQVKPRIRSWELYFQGSMWCPGWTPIRGEALTRSRSGVVNKTVQDFVRKALAQNLITEEEARNWLTQG